MLFTFTAEDSIDLGYNKVPKLRRVRKSYLFIPPK